MVHLGAELGAVVNLIDPYHPYHSYLPGFADVAKRLNTYFTYYSAIVMPHATNEALNIWLYLG